MSEVLFDIVFKGKFAGSIDQQKAELHFSKLFKLPIEKARLFFDGKPRTLKKSLTMDKASNMREVLKKAGLRVTLVKQESEQSTTTDKKQALTMSNVGVVIVNKPFVPPKHFDTSKLKLDEVGVEIVHKVEVPEPEYDLHDLSLDEVGVEIIQKKHIPHPDIDVSGLTVDEVGAIFSKKNIVSGPHFDLSNLSLDDVGSVLVEKKQIAKPEINTENITLQD
jgi:hypothetical protein